MNKPGNSEIRMCERIIIFMTLVKFNWLFIIARIFNEEENRNEY